MFITLVGEGGPSRPQVTAGFVRRSLGVGGSVSVGRSFEGIE